jgi:hypothetical protein
LRDILPLKHFTFIVIFFLIRNNLCKSSILVTLISCNSFVFVIMKYIFPTDLRSSKTIEAKKSFLRECTPKNYIASFTKATKIVPREHSVSLPKLQKVVPKGAQCKFSAQKSFQRECRAKYRRNIRRSVKSQREYRQNRR